MVKITIDLYMGAKEDVANAVYSPYNIYNLHEARRLLEPGFKPVEKFASLSIVCPSLVSAVKKQHSFDAFRVALQPESNSQ